MSDPNSDQVLFQVVESVTDTFLKMPAVAAAPPSNDQLAGDQWTGTVQITGGFNGAIRLSCSRAFAHKAARTVFGEDYPVDDAFACDVLAELTNILGGNIKCLFSEWTSTVCAMSIPVIETGDPKPPATAPVKQFWADCESDLIGISIFETPSASTTAAQ